MQTIEDIKKKYETYVSNIQWHIKTNNPPEVDIQKLDSQLNYYDEMICDLSKIQEVYQSILSPDRETSLETAVKFHKEVADEAINEQARSLIKIEKLEEEIKKLKTK